jgi:hypothetical protein
MKTFYLLILTVLVCAAPTAAQSDDPTASEAIRRARGELDSSVVADDQLEKIASQLDSCLAEFRGDAAHPGLVQTVAELESRLDAVRNSDLMGRWLGTLSEATLAWMAFPEREFAPSKIAAMVDTIQAAKNGLEPLFQVEEGARTGSRIHLAVGEAEKVLALGDRAREEQVRRAAFLARYEAEWATVPDAERATFSDKPTLAVALKARLGRLLAEAHAREQATIEEMELRYAAERAQGVASARAARIELEIEQKRKMSMLTRGVIEAEFQIDVQRELGRLQHAEDAASRLAAERERRTAELRLELQRTKSQVLDLERAMQTIQTETKLKALPPEVIGRVRLLSARGFWKPHFHAPCDMDPAARYESLEPVPHSLAALTASGCLDETPDGMWALYVVLANPRDNKRPRMIIAGWPPHLSWDPNDTLRRLQDNPAAYKTLREVQQTLRVHGEDLVALGYLAR